MRFGFGLVLIALLAFSVFADDAASAGQAAGGPSEAPMLPDLVFASASLEPSTVTGGEIFVTAKVKNEGKAEAGPFYVYLYALPQFTVRTGQSQVAWGADCKLTRRQNTFVNGLGPGETADVLFAFTCKNAGRKTLLLKADFFNKVRESNENNNIVKVATEFKRPVTRPGCSDSDGGVAPFERGFVTQASHSAYDTCVGTFLREYICDADGKLAYQLVTCAKGCLNGACRN